MMHHERVYGTPCDSSAFLAKLRISGSFDSVHSLQEGRVNTCGAHVMRVPCLTTVAFRPSSVFQRRKSSHWRVGYGTISTAVVGIQINMFMTSFQGTHFRLVSDSYGCFVLQFKNYTVQCISLGVELGLLH
jgi:hypothetical protein